MSHKDRHYWAQLRSALTGGQWSSNYPAKTPNGSLLSWSELFRKFNKHCRGFNDVAEVASHTHALANLLSANSTNDDQDDAPRSGEYLLDLSNECLLPNDLIDEATRRYNLLKGLKASNFDSLNSTLAYYAYAMGNPFECLSHLANVPDLLHPQSHMQSQNSIHASSSVSYAPTFETGTSSSIVGGSFASVADSPVPEVRDGRAWSMTETFRSLCLQGMSQEKLSPSEPRKALKIYSRAFPLFNLAASEIAVSSAPSTSPTSSFNHVREMWRWIERLIWRAVVLCSRTSDLHRPEGNDDSIWTWFSHYRSCSASWPANFRTVHRSTISVLSLRALILQHGPTSVNMVNGPERPPLWLHAARSAVNDYRAILSACTTFPRAGERNTKVEDFVDLCLGIWEASGAIGDHAGWIIDILWWATRLTFNSYRVLRHMTRLLHASGDTALAKRTLRLYIQVVGKAWQANSEMEGEMTDTNQSWVETLVAGARMLCRSASSNPGLEGIEDVREAGTCLEKARKRLNADASDDEGRRLRASVDLAEGIWVSVLALKEQEPHTRPTRLAAAHALFLQSVNTYPTSSAYFHLALSFARPGPSQDLKQAIENAGLALEGDSKEIRYWHLLGFLLAATEQWKAASEILERGAELGGNGVEETVNGEGNGENEGRDNEDDGHGAENSIETTIADDRTLRRPSSVSINNDNTVNLGDLDHRAANGSANSTTSAASDTKGSRPPLYLLETNAAHIPVAASLLTPPPDHELPSKQDVFEYALQLRMTQAVLTEVVEGAEGAELKWVEIFSWHAYAEKRASGSECMLLSAVGFAKDAFYVSLLAIPTPRPSMDESRASPDKSATFVVTPPSTSEHLAQAQAPIHTKKDSPQSNLQAIPITVSPAPPDNEPRTSSEKPEKPEKKNYGGLRVKRSSSIDQDTSTSKKVQQMLKNRVHQGRAGITTISRKIGGGVVKNGSLKKSSSTPDFHAVLRQTSYQASSIHSRPRLSSIIHSYDRTPTVSPPPPPSLPPSQESKRNIRTTRSNRLLADLWLMSAATFRRLGKIEQTKAAIQEAEVRDEDNPAVWVQLGLYYVALGQNHHAIDALQKALLISPDDVSASVHLSRVYLLMEEGQDNPSPTTGQPCSGNVDLAAGILSRLTRGTGWDVPEAWYFLAKAYRMQGRKEREKECQSLALKLSETRGIREMGAAIGWCI
ncbi:hypothetical protein L208DRAFT_1439479 [Tricholoma matsutake]|nr:hypothetical protein L208DRAFT_1439479 [Tricholoma matsutake 945]